MWIQQLETRFRRGNLLFIKYIFLRYILAKYIELNISIL